jgi:thiol-disulfide isomerase/thioredoxin
LNPKVDERSAETSAEDAGNWPDAGRLIAESLEGEVVHLSELRGQVVFINFWATWCPPCIAELPSIERLAEDASLREGASGSAPIAFMLVSLDEDRAAVEAFVRRKEITLPVYMLRMKDREPMDVSRIPSTYVVSADGRIAYSRGGLANYDTRRFKAFMKELAKQPALSGPEPVSGLEPASVPEP